MRNPLIAAVASALLTTLATGSNASAADMKPATMPLGYRVIAPAGFRAYCRATPSECVSAHLPAPATETPETGASPRAGSLWQTAFLQVRAEREFPTGSVRLRRQGTFTPQNWRARLRPESAPLAVASSIDEPFDRSTPSEAASRQADMAPEAATLSFTADNRRLLQRVNRAENARIRPAKDEDFGQGADVWGARAGEDGALYGDCEDYVLAKRTALIAEGVPTQALSIAVARNTSGQSHAVLVVSTDKGDVVLDNLSYWIRPWADVPYQWIMRQNHGDANDWRAIVSVDRVGQTPSRGTRSRRL